MCAAAKTQNAPSPGEPQDRRCSIRRTEARRHYQTVLSETRDALGLFCRLRKCGSLRVGGLYATTVDAMIHYRLSPSIVRDAFAMRRIFCTIGAT